MNFKGLRRDNAFRRYAAILVAMCVALVGAVVLNVQQAAPAFAATKGVGVDFETVGFLGSFELENGERAYCVEIKVWEPWAAQQPVALVTSLPSFSGDLMIGSMLGMGGVELNMPTMNDAAHMRQINYILSTWGDTLDDAQAAAVALAVFAVRGDPIGYNEALQREVTHDGGGAVVQRALNMVEEAKEKAGAPEQGTAPEAPVLRLDEHGTGEVEYFAGTHTVTLNHAVFDDDGSSTRSVDPSRGGTLPIRGLKPDGWDASYDITVTTDWANGADGWRATGFLLEGSDSVVTTVEHVWAPKIETQVRERILRPGDAFIDEVSVAADPNWGDWARDADGTYMPLIAEGTLYGPLESDPTGSPLTEAPADAPIAAVTTLEIQDGPGTYVVSAPERAHQTGYYTWVWRFTWEDQLPQVTVPQRTGQSALLQDAFPIVDAYGQASETHVVQQRLALTTRLIEGEVGLGWSLIDDVAVVPEDMGGLLADEAGNRIPIVLRGTVYHSSTEPVQSSHVPDHVRAIAETTIVTSTPGIHSSDPIALPLDLDGYVTMQWCIRDEDQAIEYQGLTREWCDDYGVPAETAQVVSPRVSTVAQPEAIVGDSIYDDALVEGLVPNEAELFFTAYLKPEAGQPKFDEQWRDTGAVWTSEEIERLTEVERCLAQPVVITKPQKVWEAGTYRSPEVETHSAGTIHWVESLTAVDPTTGDRHTIHSGECGLAQETTVITHPEVPELAVTGDHAAQRQTVVGLAVMISLSGLLLVGISRYRRRVR